MGRMGDKRRASEARSIFDRAMEARDRRNAVAAIDGLDQWGLREAVTAQFERLHPQGPLAAKLAAGFARRVMSTRVRLVGPPMGGASLGVGFTRPLLEPLSPVALHHARDRVERKGLVLVDEAAARVLDDLVDDVARRRIEDEDMRSRFERWLAAAALREPEGLATAIPELTPYVLTRLPEGPRH